MKKGILKYLRYLWKDDKGNNTPEDIAWNIAISKIQLFVELLSEPNIEKMIEDIDSKIEQTAVKTRECESALYLQELSYYIKGLEDAKEIINSYRNDENGEIINKILELSKQ